MVLMCPQHWIQVANDHSPNPHGNWSYQQGGEFFMEWRQHTLRKTIPWDERTDTDWLYTTPDTRQYQAFVDQFDAKNKMAQWERVCYNARIDWEANVVTDDDSYGNNDWGGAEPDNNVKLLPLPQPQLRAHGRTVKSKRPESHPTTECTRACVLFLKTEPKYYYCPITLVMA
jgi:hypothetical protein